MSAIRDHAPVGTLRVFLDLALYQKVQICRRDPLAKEKISPPMRWNSFSEKLLSSPMNKGTQKNHDSRNDMHSSGTITDTNRSITCLRTEGAPYHQAPAFYRCCNKVLMAFTPSLYRFTDSLARAPRAPRYQLPNCGLGLGCPYMFPAPKVREFQPMCGVGSRLRNCRKTGTIQGASSRAASLAAISQKDASQD